MKILLTWLLWLFCLINFTNGGHYGYRMRRSSRNIYKMCVPETLFELCQQMSKEQTKTTAQIVCISARDRLECIEKIQEKKADFGPVDPEDMYVASKISPNEFSLFEEIRTKEEPDAEYRYEAVAVIHKDLNISNVKQIAGLKSCHTGVGRNVGYKIPLTKLKNMGIIGNLVEPDLSPRENELKAFSDLFSKACIVGKWSPDATIDSKLKKKYSNLCQLCEHPEKCDYPDTFSGYEGALRCLALNGGQIAWTKIIYVKKFFGLPVGITPAVPSDNNPEMFSYFCPDGSRNPITTERPCRWAARPWPAYMTNSDVVKTVDDLRQKIENLGSIGVKNHSPWLEKVLELSDKTRPKENKIISPGDYLDKANYTDVIERNYGPPFRSVRFCVTDGLQLKKCQDLSRSAFSRDIRPQFDCIEEKSVTKCLQTVRDNGADVITLDADMVQIAQMSFNLLPILAEQYDNNSESDYTVAVVKKGWPIKSMADLEGKQCPLYMPKILTDFYSSGKSTPLSKCNLKPNDVLVYSNISTGTFRCFVQGGADIALVSHNTILENTDNKNTDTWANKLKSTDFELWCPPGGKQPVTDYKSCYLAEQPPRMVVTNAAKSEGELDEIRNALISASVQYTKRPDLFRLFGVFNGETNLLFKDTTTGLTSITEDWKQLKDYNEKILVLLKNCVKK